MAETVLLGKERRVGRSRETLRILADNVTGYSIFEPNLLDKFGSQY
jgi:hypothetical protein